MEGLTLAVLAVLAYMWARDAAEAGADRPVTGGVMWEAVACLSLAALSIGLSIASFVVTVTA